MSSDRKLSVKIVVQLDRKTRMFPNSTLKKNFKGMQRKKKDNFIYKSTKKNLIIFLLGW